MSKRNIRLIDTVHQYELIKGRDEKELFIRSPEGANFILNIDVAKAIVSIFLFDLKFQEHFNIPESKLKEQLTMYEGNYKVDSAKLRQDRSLLAEVEGYLVLPSSYHGKDFVHLQKDGVNFILSINVLFNIVERYINQKLDT